MLEKEDEKLTKQKRFVAFHFNWSTNFSTPFQYKATRHFQWDQSIALFQHVNV